VQPERRTAQGAIEERLSSLFDRPVRVIAAGRTDAGVHAVGQEIVFDAPVTWNAADLRRAVNALPPDDVWVETIRRAAPDFHPRYSATGRRYEYYIGTADSSRSPVRAGRIWRPDHEIDARALREGGRLILGEGSFEAFSKTGQPERGTRCTVEKAEWVRSPLGDLRLTIVADRFLHHMVRYLVATMVDVATGRRDWRDLRALLAATGGVRPPEPAPAKGLYLTGVRFADGWNRPPGVPGLWPTPDTGGGAGDYIDQSGGA
jgi:tRNA pseudouridine38-40 synthase